MTQQPIVGDQCFLLSEFRDALVKICSSKVCVFIWKINNHNTFWRHFGSLTGKIGFRHGHFFRKKISSSVFIIENEPVLVASEPHLGQHAGALGSKPPAIAINSCPQQGHFAFENPVSIVYLFFVEPLPMRRASFKLFFTSLPPAATATVPTNSLTANFKTSFISLINLK